MCKLYFQIGRINKMQVQYDVTISPNSLNVAQCKMNSSLAY